jgi:hypothetical protein
VLQYSTAWCVFVWCFVVSRGSCLEFPRSLSLSRSLSLTLCDCCMLVPTTHLLFLCAVQQNFIQVNEDDKRTTLMDLLSAMKPGQLTLVFVETKRNADALEYFLTNEVGSVKWFACVRESVFFFPLPFSSLLQHRCSLYSLSPSFSRSHIPLVNLSLFLPSV